MDRFTPKAHELVVQILRAHGVNTDDLNPEAITLLRDELYEAHLDGFSSDR